MKRCNPLHTGSRAVWLLILLLLCLLSSCRETPTAVEQETEVQPGITVESIAIPVFETAEEQLNYTRSWFADIAEKRAALRAFVRLFPEEKRYCGLAALDLAYLELGSDYRLAREHEGFAAIKAYRDVIGDYPAFADIQAKAHWYIGWIYADLIGDRERGIEYFRRVADRYPDIEVALLPPAPWVSIIYSDDDAGGAAPRSPTPNTWAALALVEIIRHADDDELAWSSFETLWEKYRQDVATGFGLKLILARRVHVDRSLIMARQYMEKYFFNVHILSDIEKLIQQIENEESL